jgi:hypothetical protein
VLSTALMASVKACLRKLVRERPDIAEVLVRELVVGVVTPAAKLALEAADQRRVVMHPAIDPDLLARVSGDELLHLEFQDYPDAGFVDRLFRQHLSLVLRYPERLVTTVAFWLVRPPHPHRVEVVRRGRVMVHLASVVLPELRASRLLARDELTCFAAAAEGEGWTDDELCELVAAGLQRSCAAEVVRDAAVALAATRGREEALMRALGA